MAFQILTLLTGIVVGWIKKGSIWSIVNVRIRYLLLLPGSYILQHVSIAYLHGLAFEAVLVFSYVSLIVFCVANVKVPGLMWTLMGTLANFVAMAANGLRMPAYVPAVKKIAPSLVDALLKGNYGKSVAMSSATHLNFLGDIFSFEIRPVSLISVGDIMFAIGLVVFIQYAMRIERREPQDADNAKAAS